MIKTGVLLLNLGTPDSPDPRSVYRYLTEFLNDPRVIDLAAPARWILTNAIIVPFRHKQSAAAYQKIWTKVGSPLLVNSQKLADALSTQLGTDYQVALGMRYGNPNIEAALKQLTNCDKLVIVPLFPQYSSAATGSAIEKTLSIITKQWNIPSIEVKSDFYANAGFIAACVDVIQKKVTTSVFEHLVLSYHGLPERHIDKSHCQANCDRTHACPAIDTNNAYCYRAQCYATSTAIVKQLNLSSHQYSVAFQSRLGRTPWIKPYTDLLLPTLRQQGVKNIAIACPSFVSDCLETLEEVNIRAREQWASLGGSGFTFIPCINDNPIWVDALADMVRQPVG
jgi:ferrochelatase